MRKFGKYEKMRKNAILQTYITSLICLVLCVTMFFGTSMAWFTDTAESTQNEMYVGTLDIELKHASFKNGSLGDYALVEKVADEDNPIIDPAIKWEPGYTAVEKFELTEKGDLAFSYQMGIECAFTANEKGNEEEKKLIASAITVWNYTGTNANEYTLPTDFDVMTAENWEPVGTLLEVIEDNRAVFSGEMEKDKVNATTTVTENDKQTTVDAPAKAYHIIALHMEETFADSSVQGKTLDDITIKLVATQKASEQDAFGSSYDDFVFVNTEEKLTEAIVNGETKLLLSEGTYVLPQEAQGKTLQIAGTGNPADTVIATNTSGSYEGCNYNLNGSTVVFENITINTDNLTYTGYSNCDVTFNNCIINNSYTLYGNSEFNNCVLNVSGDQYNIWTWGAPVATFNNCTFNSDGKAILLYGGADTKLTVNKCTFNDTGILTDMKAAIEIGRESGKYTVVVNNTTVNGYEINDEGINTGTTLWGNKNSMGTDELNVIVDGVDVY